MAKFFPTSLLILSERKPAEITVEEVAHKHEEVMDDTQEKIEGEILRDILARR